MLFWWNCYGGSSSVSPVDDEDWAGGEAEGGRSYYNADESIETRSSKRTVAGDNSTRAVAVAPSIDDLDPSVTAAIITQAAFRGYRVRHRLRQLPAREAERAIRALHANAHGFRRIALFLVFVGLFFSLVFSGADVAFQRTVHQGLENHLSMAKYGPEQDRTHKDVTSLAELYQWMQAFYLNTYHGTELEDRCTACVIKPPDDVCNACEFDIEDANTPESSLGSINNNASTSDGHVRRRSAAVGSSSNSNSSASRSGGSGINRRATSKECEACVVGRFCTGRYLEICAASLDEDSSTSPLEQNYRDEPGDIFSMSSSGSSTSDASFDLAINATALDAVDLYPVGGISAAGGDLVIENINQCRNFDAAVGVTENVARYKADLSVLFNTMAFVADRNRIVGGMLIVFTRRMRLSEGECKASRDYIDVCLADKENKETIIPAGAWADLRPDKEVVHMEAAGGYPILIDTGRYNTGLNRGLCVLLVMEDLDIIPAEEVESVSVELVTYNGNQKTAFGSISVDFTFDDGGKIVVSESIAAYSLKRPTKGSSYMRRWASLVLFVGIFLGMVRHDMSNWWRLRRSKTKRTGNCWHCVCGFTFFALMFVNMLLWLAWAIGFSGTDIFEADASVSDMPNIDLLADEVLLLNKVARFLSTYYFVFLLTTMAGLYRWIFQMLTFHKRMSIVADTLSGACTHLQHFLFVAFLVALVFTNLTWFLVGSRSEDFSTTGGAWRSVIRVSLGEYEFYSQILGAQPTLGPVIVVVYQVLGLVLLLNVVIAVLLEAYRVVAEGVQDEDTILQSLVAFVGMTLCMGKARIQWTNAYVHWRLSGGASRHERRPSYKLSLQGPNTVCGVDGRPVMLIKKPSGSPLMPADRQLSFNCPRYISVADMQVLIKAAPVPAYVADRVVRKIVNEWIFRSTEKTSKDMSVPSCSGSHGDSSSSSSGEGSIDSRPTLRRPDSSVPSTSP